MTYLDQAKELILILNNHNYDAYLVGGCVRDMLLNMTPNDYDITTNASPDEVKEVFSNFKIVETGIKHGTVTIVTENGNYEITTFRTDGEYTDYRHPDSVKFTKNLIDDLSRRDFTINAIAQAYDGTLTDPFNGQTDLSKKLIRCVGNPNERFKEDPLRMLRAIRFAAKLNYKIEDETLNAIKSNAKLILKISNERIAEELRGILVYNPGMVELLQSTGLLKYFMPEVDNLINVSQNNRWHYTDVFHHTMDALKYSMRFKLSNEKLFYIRMALLLHDSGKILTKTVDENGYEHFYGHPEYSYSIALTVLKRLKLSNEEIEIISKLVHYHDENIIPKRRCLLKFVDSYKMSLSDFKLLGFVKEADISAHVQKENDTRMEYYFKLLQMYKQKLKTDKLFSIDKLVITGEDIMLICDLQPCKKVGEIKQALYEMCFLSPRYNNRDYLIEYLKENKNKLIGE